LQKQLYEADSDTQGHLECLDLEEESLPALSISWDDDTKTTELLHCEYDSAYDSNPDMDMEDDVNTQYGVRLDGDVDIEKDGDDPEDNEEEEDEQEEDEEEVGEVEEEDEDEDDSKEPWMIGQGEMVNSSAVHVDSMVHDQPIVLPEQGQEMCYHNPLPKPPAPPAWPPTPEPRPHPRTPGTHPLSVLVFRGFWCHINIPQWCQLWEKLGHQETARM